MIARQRSTSRSGNRVAAASSHRTAFTLTELLVVIAVISILASTLLFAMWGAVEEAKAARTRAQITKLNDMLMTRWVAYRTRAVRLGLPLAARQDGRAATRARLNAIRDLMRMEMPDRKTDVTDDPVQIPIVYGSPSQSITRSLAIPSLLREYRRRATQNNTRSINLWTEEYEDSECLYMIIGAIRDLDGGGLDFLHEGEIGDLDGDEMPEILDAWGRPIAFLRWPAGFVEHPGADFTWGTADDIPYYTDLQRFTVDGTDLVVPEYRDPFDPLRIDNRPGVAMPAAGGAGNAKYFFNYAIYPLVFSAGPDQVYDIVRFDNDTSNALVPFHYYRDVANPYGGWANDPYSILPTNGRRLGEPFASDGTAGYADNIHNHALGGQ